MGLGADDYVTRPLCARELIARIKLMLRRVEQLSGRGASPTTMIRIGNIAPHVDGRVVLVKGERISLTCSEFDILKVLMHSPNCIYSRLDLIQQPQMRRKRRTLF